MHGKKPLQPVVDSNFTSIFVKDFSGKIAIHDCWPKDAAWVDFLNENAQKFWQRQMIKFEGTNSNYSYWIDMNEPSVFNNPVMTLPLHSLHYTKDGKAVMHRDVHNMYGTL